MLHVTRLTVWAFLLACVALLAGCGGSPDKVAPAKGKITFNGQAVKGGSLTLRPVGEASSKDATLGKPAYATVGDDGTFVMSTNGQGDGACIGKHEVMYTPNIVGAQSYDDKPAPSPYAGMVAKPSQIEIKSGANEINLELAPGVPGKL